MKKSFLRTPVRPLICAFAMALTTAGASQSDTDHPSLLLTAYAEIYYAYDFNQPEDHLRPSFLYSHNRHNEVNLNLGYLKAAYARDHVRANLALAVGTYVNANYAAEPGVLKNVYEANAGVRLGQSAALWLDAGIFASHIGAESAVSKNCPTLTRSIQAENSPYYESGVKLTYTTKNDQWLFSALFLNGWQRIQRPDGNNTPAFGSQITFTPSDKVTLNHSSFIGNDKPDDVKQMRYFQNLYGIISLTDQWQITAGLDIGLEEKSPDDHALQSWYSPLLIVKYQFHPDWAITGRWEYYGDPGEVIVPTGTPNGFKTMGWSANLDYALKEGATWRIEARWLRSEDAIFEVNDGFEKTNFCLTSSIAVELD